MIEIDGKKYAQWKDSPYYCDEDGNVYRKLKSKFRQLSPYPKTSGKSRGRYIVHICLNYKRYEVGVAKMMWESFRGEIPQGYCVIHINGAKSMNDLFNLKLARIEDVGRLSKKSNPKSKAVIDTRTKKVYRSVRDCAKALGVSATCVSDNCNDKFVSNTITVAWFDRKKAGYERNEYKNGRNENRMDTMF